MKKNEKQWEKKRKMTKNKMKIKITEEQTEKCKK